MQFVRKEMNQAEKTDKKTILGPDFELFGSPNFGLIIVCNFKKS